MAERHIWLIRHAKAEAHGRADHGRELAYRGFRQCVEMGSLLATQSNPPSVFLTSDARRTYTTAHFLNAFVRGEVTPSGEMYTYDVEVLASAVGTAMDDLDLVGVDSVAVVGHNSAISDLIALLTRDSSTPSLSTLGMAELVFNGDWDDLWSVADVTLRLLVKPSGNTK